MKLSRRTTLLKVGQQQNLQLRSKIRSYMPEAPAMTVWQKHALRELFFEKAFKPVILGEVDIREVFTPSGGWAKLDARYPNLRRLPIEKQLTLGLRGR